MPLYRLFSVFVICCALTIAGCSKSSTEAGLEKEDLDGDGIGNIYDPDIDGDGIPNSSDPDIDGDGIPNDQDPDMDGDGKPNGKDPDIDGDGTSNEIDNTPTGDTWGPGAQGQCPGDATGAYPNCACPSGSQYNAQTNDCVADDPAGIGVEDPGIRYCDRIQVYGLNEEQTTSSQIELTWKLFSSQTGGDCVLKEGVNADLIQVRASAAGAEPTASEQTNPVINTRARIQIPFACTGETVEVTYDFNEIATLIKADPYAPGWIVQQRHKADRGRCDLDGDGSPDFGPAACRFGNRTIKAAVDAYIANGGNFANCGPIGTWDVSGVTNMSGLFDEKENFNEDISKWNVSNVDNMSKMFMNAKAFNQDISGWNVSKVTNMDQMFWNAKAFNQPIGNWDVSKVTDMSYMFNGAPKFNQNISGWNVSNVTDMTGMFRGAKAFNQPIGNWEVSEVGQMKFMFKDAQAFNQDISGWCVTNISVEPDDFDVRAGFAGQTEKQPRWGTCPGVFVASSANDADGDGIPNGSDPDVDGDGIPNTSDKDIDGDGIENKNDPDIDGDGIKNGIDNDSDGDGTPDTEDETPGGPR